MKWALALVLLPALAAADDTRLVTSGRCTVAVPAAWKGDHGIAHSPDKKAHVLVDQPTIESFDQLKATAKSVYKDDKVKKDTATELELEGKSLRGKPNVYRAIASADKALCVAEVIYESGSADDARAIARSLAPAAN